MAAPTFVSYTTTDFAAVSSTSKTTASITVQEGDRIVAKGSSETGSGASDISSISSASVTLSQAVTVGSANDVRSVIYTGTVGTGVTSITVTVNRAGAGTYSYGVGVEVWRGSDGFGATASVQGDTTSPYQCSITTTQANSAVSMVAGDWNAVNHARTLLTSAGTGTEEEFEFQSGRATYLLARWNDAGATGTYNIGFTSASSLDESIAAVEIKGTASGDVSRSLTGQSVTVSAGSLASAVSQALSGQAVTASAGTVVPAVAQALSGQVVTASAGTAVAAIDYALSGQQITTAQGTVGAQSGGDVSVNLTGQAVTVSAGSLTAAVSQALSGQQISASAGSVIAEVAPVLSGLGIVVSQGSVGTEVGGDVSRALTGQSITVEQGTLGTEGGDAPEPTGAGGWPTWPQQRSRREVEEWIRQERIRFGVLPPDAPSSVDSPKAERAREEERRAIEKRLLNAASLKRTKALAKLEAEYIVALQAEAQRRQSEAKAQQQAQITMLALEEEQTVMRLIAALM